MMGLHVYKKGYIRNIKSEVAAEFYEKAGDMGQLISYSSAADIWVVLGDYDKAKSLYLKQGSKGNPSGYLALLKWYNEDSCQAIELRNKMENMWVKSSEDNWFEARFTKLLKVALSL